MTGPITVVGRREQLSQYESQCINGKTLEDECFIGQMCTFVH